MTSQDAATLMREAQALKAAGRLDEAVRRYGEAVAANPRSGVAEHNLAACLGDAGRWAEAEPHVAAALAKGLDAPETWLVKARCDQALGQVDKAEAAFREALQRRPIMYDALRELAQLYWMKTGNVAAMLAPLEAAMRQAPGDAYLAMIKAQALEFAGELEPALALMTEVSRALPGDATYAARAAQLAGELGKSQEALTFAEHARRVAPQDQSTQLTLATTLLGVGDPERALGVLSEVRRVWSTNQHAIALQATAWRMLGDARYRQLYDYSSMVMTAMLDTPAGWTSREAYVADVAAALHRLHAFREHPFSHSVRHGSQAVDIFHQNDPALRALPKALDGPIRAALRKLGAGADPLRARNRGTYDFQGMWSVKLRPGGYHVDHVHQEGWISSACYLETVKPNGNEGWLRFGQPGVKTHPKLEAEHYVEPKPGMLALFPSYMWHGTVPFSGDQTRLTFAFDLIPGAAADMPGDG